MLQGKVQELEAPVESYSGAGGEQNRPDSVQEAPAQPTGTPGEAGEGAEADSRPWWKRWFGE